MYLKVFLFLPAQKTYGKNFTVQIKKIKGFKKKSLVVLILSPNPSKSSKMFFYIKAHNKPRNQVFLTQGFTEI